MERSTSSARGRSFRPSADSPKLKMPRAFSIDAAGNDRAHPPWHLRRAARCWIFRQGRTAFVSRLPTRSRPSDSSAGTLRKETLSEIVCGSGGAEPWSPAQRVAPWLKFLCRVSNSPLRRHAPKQWTRNTSWVCPRDWPAAVSTSRSPASLATAKPAAANAEFTKKHKKKTASHVGRPPGSRDVFSRLTPPRPPAP